MVGLIWLAEVVLDRLVTVRLNLYQLLKQLLLVLAVLVVQVILTVTTAIQVPVAAHRQRVALLVAEFLTLAIMVELHQAVAVVVFTLAPH